jgi:hypothetical protein
MTNLSASRIALVGSALALALAGPSRVASAQDQTQPLGPGVPFNMPPGITSEPTSPPREAPRPRIPAGENALEQIKKQSPPAGTRDGSPATPR